jgi:hypothetical protein
MKIKFCYILLTTFALFLGSCSNTPVVVPASNSTTNNSADPTDEDDMRSQLVSGIGFDELGSAITNSKSKDKITTSYSLDFRNDKITSTLVGDKTDLREVRVKNEKTKRFDNDVITHDYTGNSELRTNDLGMIENTYVWCDLVNFYSTNVYSKNSSKIITKETLFPYDIIKYQEIMYLGVAHDVDELTDENYNKYTLAGHLSDGTIYARNQTVVENSVVINSNSFNSQTTSAKELFYKDNFLYEVRLSIKQCIDTNKDGIYNLIYSYQTSTSIFAQGSNGKFDISSIPSDSAKVSA